MASHSRNNAGNVLTLTDITLRYGQVYALKQIHFAIGPSEIHAIVGEHGSGKTSLGLIISGLQKPDSGVITVDGNPYRSFSLNTAQKLGIEMVHQQLSLNPHFTVAKNFFINIPIYALTRDRKALRATVRFLSRYDIDIDAATPVKHLNISDQVLVDIFKRLYAHPRLLILDEALEKLSPAGFEKTIHVLKEFVRQGMSIVWITRRIEDIYNVADNISVIKNGEILISDDVKHLDKINLIKMAYTQLSDEGAVDGMNQEFYHLLKYNEAILRNLPVNLIVTDREQHIKLVNDHCKHSFDLDQPSYWNVALEQLFSAQNQHLRDIFQQVFSADTEQTFYHIPVTFHGRAILTNLRTFPIRDGQDLIGYIFVIEDMTEYDRLQKQMMLSEKLASVGLLAAGVAHEINNPLSIIYSYLRYINRTFPDNALHEAIDNVREEISSIAHIVSNLHAFSDNQQITHDDVDLNDLIHTILNLIKHSAKYKAITIHFTPYAGQLSITANKNEIKQVVLNLLKNSVEAMPSGGDIFITTSLLQHENAQVVRLTFQDTGPGICDENLDNIFLPFYSSKKGQESNLGLGLSVSYGIVTKYHGTMTVENTESGCAFIVDFPNQEFSRTTLQHH